VRLLLAFLALILAGSTTAFVLGSPASAPAPHQGEWNAEAAASHLDDRMSSWLDWPTAARDQGTSCVSCHTVLPYALARPSLRQELSERGPAMQEEVMLEHVTTRVRLWRDIEPYYPDQRFGLPKTSESRGTEAVLNALVLASRDAEAGAMSDDLRLAFSNLWELQMTRGPLQGAWPWLEFALEPFEGPRSSYFGAGLAAIAIGMAPDDYASTPEIQEQLALLRQYLGRGADSESLFIQLTILWAASELDGLLEESQRRSIVDAAIAAQEPDGGWNLAGLAPWQRTDGSVLPDDSDGFATALAVLALQRTGDPAATAAVERGRAWLIDHQDPETGAIPAQSINRERDPATEPAWFMSDAATALASLALTEGTGAIEVEEDLVYCFVDGAALLADIAWPANASDVPAILYVHGGRWRAGSRTAASGLDVRDWAGEGYFAMTISFRLVGSTPAPAPQQDLMCAIRWLHTHANRYGIDTDRIYLSGWSSGGHQVTLAATLGDDGYPRTGGWEEADSHVRAAMSISAPYELSTLSWGDFWSPLEGDQEEARQLASPIHQIGPDSRPILIVHSDDDGSVPVEQALDMVRALEEAGRPHRFVHYTDRGHVALTDEVVEVMREFIAEVEREGW